MPDFPHLYHGRPDWPSQDDERLFWIGLHTDFSYAHHPVEKRGRRNINTSDNFGKTFCKPADLCQKLGSLIKESSYGSILVTGYRGTGKTSLVCLSIDQITTEKRLEAAAPSKLSLDAIPHYFRVDVNLSTVTSAHEVLVLTYEALERRLIQNCQKLTERAHAAGLLALKQFFEKEQSPFNREIITAIQKVAERYSHSSTSRRLQAHVSRKPQTRNLNLEDLIQLTTLCKILFADNPECRCVLELKTLLDTAESDFKNRLTTFSESIDDQIARKALQRLLKADPASLLQFSLWAADDIKAFTDAQARFQSIISQLNNSRRDLRSATMIETTNPPLGFATSRDGERYTQSSPGAQYSFQREALSRHQALLVEYLRDLVTIEHRRRYAKTLIKPHPAATRLLKPIFVFDELDKLLPVESDQPRQTEGSSFDESPEVRKLAQLQRIVAELKFLFSQSPSHQILIAGKDVDDSWSMDQNRGSGLFESIFVANLHVPSIFSCKLLPCRFGVGGAIYRISCQEKRASTQNATKNATLSENPEKTLNLFYEVLTRELGIAKNSWSYNTALIILPHLAEYEIFQLLTRAHMRAKGRDALIREWRKVALSSINYSPANENGGCPSSDKTNTERNRQRMWFKQGPMSERSCRRLNTLILYLTYKGRGIPRKILREFYDTILERSAVPIGDAGTAKLGNINHKPTVRYLIAFPQHHLQKMNFYAGVVATLDQSYPELRGLNDKGRVSIFHVLDYILKFYGTGFSLRDLEHANFMTSREEIYPSRQLANLLLRLLDGRLWRRKDFRSPEFRLLHNVVHDLGVMFLRYGPEQSELRHVTSDFKDEVIRLQGVLKDVQNYPPGQRIAPVHAQIRLSRIFEITGNHYEARLGYYRALRWLRADLAAIESYTTHDSRSFSPSTSAERRDRHPLTTDFVIAPVTYAMEVLLAVGRLHEETGEYPAALQHYLEAERIYGNYILFLRLWPSESAQTASRPFEKEVGERLHALLSTLLPSPVAPEQDPQWQQEITKLSEVIELSDISKPVQLSCEPAGLGQSTYGILTLLVEAYNHASIAYAKVWENVSSNRYLLRSLYHLRTIGDEYGIIDQLFLIGQIMVRRRDFRAAAQWYLSALKHVQRLRSYNNFEVLQKQFPSQRFQQSGAQWQTHTATTTIEAQIFSALGDVWFATDGVAFLSEEDVRKCIWRLKRSKTPSSSTNAYPLNQFLQRRSREVAGTIIKNLRTHAHEDRIEEYFHTQARYLFQAVGDEYSANDVYLRQIEVRAEAIRHSAYLIDNSLNASPDYKYRYLNSWRFFWRGARVLLRRFLTTASSIARHTNDEEGRVNANRRMGSLLRVIGSVLTDLALRKYDSNSRRLLLAQSVYHRILVSNDDNPSQHPSTQFYRSFIAETFGYAANERSPDNALVIRELREVIENRAKCVSKGKPPTIGGRSLMLRVGVNAAVRDLRRIFRYLSDNRDPNYLMSNASDCFAVNRHLARIGFRSPLFRISASDKIRSGFCELPLATALLNTPPSHTNEEFLLTMRCMVLAEQAHLTGFVNYRDSIPDYGYASSSTAIAELYLTSLYSIFQNVLRQVRNNVTVTAFREHYRDIYLAISDIAKRYLSKAVDILLRERDQNRNTFHLMSEAHFNLGDLLLLRLAALECASDGESDFHTGLTDEKQSLHLSEALFGMQLFKTGDTMMLKGLRESDHNIRDLLRQIWEHYRNGIVVVQGEMEEHASRYRFPPEVFHAHRNAMDPGLHHRICRATRMRHIANRPYLSPNTEVVSESPNVNPKERQCKPATGFDYTHFNEYWSQLSQYITYNAPTDLPLDDWLSELAPMLALINSVRSDRGPLRIIPKSRSLTAHTPSSIQWIPPTELEAGKKLALFYESYTG